MYVKNSKICLWQSDHIHEEEVCRIGSNLYVQKEKRVSRNDERNLDSDEDLADRDGGLPIFVLIEDAQAYGPRRIDVRVKKYLARCMSSPSMLT